MTILHTSTVATRLPQQPLCAGAPKWLYVLHRFPCGNPADLLRPWDLLLPFWGTYSSIFLVGPAVTPSVIDSFECLFIVFVVSQLERLQGLRTADVLSKSDPFAAVYTGKANDKGKVKYT